MSADLAAVTRPSWAGSKPQETPPSHLEVVSTRSQRKARPRTVYAAITVATLIAIVVAQLLLSVAVSQGAYQIDHLQLAQRNLQRSYQTVSENLDRRASPQNLAANAQALGMVPDSAPVYLRLSDGKVLGTPVKARASGTGALLVPNALLAGVPLVPKTPGGASPGLVEAAKPSGSHAVGASKPATPPGPVVLTGPLESPTTH